MLSDPDASGGIDFLSNSYLCPDVPAPKPEDSDSGILILGVGLILFVFICVIYLCCSIDTQKRKEIKRKQEKVD